MSEFLLNRYKFGIFFAGPLIVFMLAIFQSGRYEIWIFVPLSLLWISLAWEDTNCLSVSLAKLVVTCVATILCSSLIIESFDTIKLVAYHLFVIFTVVFLINKISGKSAMGLADFWAIGALSLTLSPSNIGLWIAVGCTLALVPYSIGRIKKNKAVPFLPYLVISWMLVFSVNILQVPFL